ncbi:MAG: NAD(P)/FAD-dependent oxidoreductase [Halieaceae bacterium]|jgi:predicted Rossmann fold flavoprotein|nr:NAD(P)/FAD-dependent oxidoreductase [Halieaceae bacterium]
MRETALDAIVIGGGASGLMCAISAGYRGLKVRVLEMGPKVGLKILVSGGGRCNFTNLLADPREQFLSDNPAFCISAMKRYRPEDFIAMVEAAGIDYHEKKLGQLFCDNSSKDIVAMLLQHCEWAGVEICLRQRVTEIREVREGEFTVLTDTGAHTAPKVVIASGGLSLPKIASDLAFRAANQLGLHIVPPRAALVPLTWKADDKARYEALAGISVDAVTTVAGTSFREHILFTHRGLSGPGILQASSYWREGAPVSINLLPEQDAVAWLQAAQQASPRQLLSSVLKSVLPRRLVDLMSGDWFSDDHIGSVPAAALQALGGRLCAWQVWPNGTEGYRTAEVTLGGIATTEVSSKTFELHAVPGLYAIGEALDVTGWLGGYNFQWAWASGWCCGQHL